MFDEVLACPVLYGRGTVHLKRFFIYRQSSSILALIIFKKR